MLINEIPIFSVKELLFFPVKEINKCDVYFSPNFNIPMGISIPIFSTVHDVVFLDITMPVIDGFGALAGIREVNPDALVVMISADRQKSTKEKVLSLGASAIISKPIDEEEFRATLLKLVF